MNQDDATFEDLVDFFRRWPRLRRRMNILLENPAMKTRDRCILRAMMLVMDRVGPEDLAGGDGSGGGSNGPGGSDRERNGSGRPA